MKQDRAARFSIREVLIWIAAFAFCLKIATGNAVLSCVLSTTAALLCVLTIPRIHIAIFVGSWVATNGIILFLFAVLSWLDVGWIQYSRGSEMEFRWISFAGPFALFVSCTIVFLFNRTRQT